VRFAGAAPAGHEQGFPHDFQACRRPSLFRHLRRARASLGPIQQAPDAAPTGAPATTAPLAPPPGAVNADVTSFAGMSIPDSGGFSIVSSFLRADIV